MTNKSRSYSIEKSRGRGKQIWIEKNRCIFCEVATDRRDRLFRSTAKRAVSPGAFAAQRTLQMSGGLGYVGFRVTSWPMPCRNVTCSQLFLNDMALANGPFTWAKGPKWITKYYKRTLPHVHLDYWGVLDQNFSHRL